MDIILTSVSNYSMKIKYTFFKAQISILRDSFIL